MRDYKMTQITHNSSAYMIDRIFGILASTESLYITLIYFLAIFCSLSALKILNMLHRIRNLFSSHD